MTLNPMRPTLDAGTRVRTVSSRIGLWLQTECPRSEGSRFGKPGIPRPNILAGREPCPRWAARLVNPPVHTAPLTASSSGSWLKRFVLFEFQA